MRCHASVQVGFAGVVMFSGTGVLAAFFAALDSLPRKTRVKNGILSCETVEEGSISSGKTRKRLNRVEN